LGGAERDGEAVGVVMEDGCAVGVSDDGRFLAVRVEPYMVGAGGFQVWLEGNGGLGTVLNCWFETRGVSPPPVLVREPAALRGAVDVFGGEQVVFEGVRNTLAPPRPASFGRDDLFLVVRSRGGIIGRALAESVERGVGREVRVVFRTPELHLEDGDRGEKLQISVEYEEVGGAAVVRQLARVGKAAELNAAAVFVAEEGGGDAVAEAKEAVVAAAAPELAETGTCDAGYNQSNVFVTVDLVLERYTADRFSAHKAAQLGAAIGDAVGGDGEVRFFEFDNDKHAAVYEVGGGGDAAAVRDAVGAAVASGAVAVAARLADGDVALGNVEDSGEVSLVCAAALVDPRARGDGGDGGFEGFGGGTLAWATPLVMALLFAIGAAAALFLGGDVFRKRYSLRSRSQADLDVLFGSTSSVLSSSSSDYAEGGRLTDRQRAESFGLHQGRVSRHVERSAVLIQPDSESGSETGTSSRNPQPPHLARNWSDRRHSDGPQQPQAAEPVPAAPLPRTSPLRGFNEWASDAGSSGGLSREERESGYAATSDPLVARLTYALRTAAGAAAATPAGVDAFIARDEARHAVVEVRASPRPYAPYGSDGGSGSRSGTPGTGSRSTPSGDSGGEPQVAAFREEEEQAEEESDGGGALGGDDSELDR
jgi:hypothetical protein